MTIIVGSCGCTVTVHRGECAYHEHDWARDHYYEEVAMYGSGRDVNELEWCRICRKTRATVLREQMGR